MVWLVVLLTLPWMIGLMSNYTLNLFEMMIQMVR